MRRWLHLGFDRGAVSDTGDRLTHEYVIALGGTIVGAATATPTAIAWAADRVLAVGSDKVVLTISRGDSTFLDLDGCRVTAHPDDSSTPLEPGSPADLDFWSGARLVAVVRDGAFTEGDEHYGPFAAASGSADASGSAARTKED